MIMCVGEHWGYQNQLCIRYYDFRNESFFVDVCVRGRGAQCPLCIMYYDSIKK